MECVVVVALRIKEGEGGVYFFGEYEEIKALFVLRGIGEWVQLCLLLSQRLSGL